MDERFYNGLTENPQENKIIIENQKTELLRRLEARRGKIRKLQDTSGPTAITSSPGESK